MSKRKFIAEKGFLTFAIGAGYAKLAHVQALSIKLTQSINNTAIIVDKIAAEELKAFPHVFDQVIELDYTGQGWDMTQYWKAFGLTPWRETFLVEADMLFPTSIDHWWDIVRQRDVCLTHEVKNFREEKITSRRFRKLFDENLLPDIYAGLVYFRYSQTGFDFFLTVKTLIQNWEWVAKEHLIKNEDMRVRIDEVFSLAARIIGMEQVTLPGPVPTFTHGKERAWDISEIIPWYEQLYVEWDNILLIIGHYHQRVPLHYHHKEWITNDVIREYERNYSEFYRSNTKL